MPIIRNVNYRKVRANSTPTEIAQLANAMHACGETALHVDLTRINTESLAFLEEFNSITHLAVQGLTRNHGKNFVPKSVVDVCLLDCDLCDYADLGHLDNVFVLDYGGPDEFYEFRYGTLEQNFFVKLS